MEIDKLRLIKMVNERSILWDSRLSNFKGADREKLAAWSEIGKEFMEFPQKVERVFRRLRELYRKELIKQKSFGNAKAKWEFFDAMSFLRPIIKERKSGIYRDLKIPIEDYAYYIGGVENRNRNVSCEMAATTMTEIPVATKLVEFEEVQQNPLKRQSTSSEVHSSSDHDHSSKRSFQEESSASFKIKDIQVDLHEKFGSLVTAKLNTFEENEAEDKMKKVLNILFN